VQVRAGESVVAGEEGVVGVPSERAAEVLARSREIDALESKMVPYIQKFKSLAKAIQVFNRI
jgi:regulator of RNase E activity RraA